MTAAGSLDVSGPLDLAAVPAALERVQYGRLDVARFVACVSVVGIHVFSAASVPWANRLSFWAVPFFFLASGMLSRPRTGDAAWLRARLLHLLLISLVWIAVGRVVHFVQDGLHYDLKSLLGDLLLGASWSHLWFLPALFLVTVAGWAAQRWRLQKAAVATGALASLAFLALLPVLSDRWGDYLYRTPMFWFFFFMLPVATDLCALKDWARWGIVPGLALLIGAGWVPSAYQSSLILLGAGLVAFWVAEWALVPAPRAFGWMRLAQASLGVYLLHPFVLALFRWLLPSVTGRPWLLWVGVVTVTLGFVLGLLWLPLARRLVS